MRKGGWPLMLELNSVERYIESIMDIKKSYALFDMHVHPFDVMGNGLTYTQNSQHEGIYSSSSAKYTPPTIGQLRISQLPEMAIQQLDPELREKMSILTARRLYTHTGASLFADHMRLSGIDKILLLPVLNTADPDDLQIKMLVRMFGDDDRFALGYSISNSVANNEISATIKTAMHKYQIKAIKIHPNITGLDLSSSSGKERVECILEAAGKAGLTVIIHGGRSPGIKDPLAASYGILRNLSQINWGGTSQTVIIAHAGTYGHDLSQINNEELPLMNRLLSQYSNLFVDVSGLEVEVISTIVKRIDTDRIFFGSDALYNSQWGSLVKLLHVLQKHFSNYEEYFLKITSLNATEHF